MNWEDRATLRAKEVCEVLGIKRTTLHKWCKAGTFPQPLQLGVRAVAWRVPDVQNWLDSRPVDQTYSDD